MSLNTIKSELAASIETKQLLLNSDTLINKINEVANSCITSLKNGGKIIFCGNGGSFADAQHLSAEFTSRFMFDRPGLPSLALGTNSSAMSAVGNDYGYEKVFSREIEAIGTDRDVLIAITTSGNSKNVLNAVYSAEAKGIDVFVFTGLGNGKLRPTCNTLNIPSRNTARIQECHILVGHIICGLVEQSIFGSVKEL